MSLFANQARILQLCLRYRHSVSECFFFRTLRPIMIKPKLKGAFASFGMRQDVVLAALFVMIIFMMILPLPTVLVDALIAINMGISIVLLMVSIYLKQPVHFSTLPTVLLIATLFRLSLSITTTRLILRDADAGSIVETFGSFVIGGDLIVGLVIFLIITIVQFVVITKGSERVAEVAARFSLDAMPGKQMSIDSDLRSGGIDLAEATYRRTMLEKESQLYGAMDGAMKFVKGDAVAGLVIIAVNILGGLAIGTLTRGMEMGDALSLYALLTVGDGLVAQIPALFLSIASGTIVTRVAKDDAQDLGSDISDQVVAQPKALQIGALVMVGFAAIPGFPTLIFLTLAALVGFVGFFVAKSTNEEEKDDDDSFLSTGLQVATGATINSATPVHLEMAENLREVLLPAELNAKVRQLRQELYQDLGIPFPTFSVKFSDYLADNEVRVHIDDVPVPMPERRVYKDELLVMSHADKLAELNISVSDKTNREQSYSWVTLSQENRLADNNITFYDATGQVAQYLRNVLYKHAADLIGVQETKALLEEASGQYSDLVQEANQSVPAMKVNEVFKRLVSEGVSIRPLRRILESLAEWGPKEKDTVMLTEYVRQHLKRQICHHVSQGSGRISAYLVPGEIEETIRNSIRQTTSGTYLTLDPNYINSLVEDIRQKQRQLSPDAQMPIIITSVEVRKQIKTLLDGESITMPVLSNQELSPDITVQPLDYIQLAQVNNQAPA